MDYRITIDINTETGEYSVQYNNMSKKGTPIDYYELMKAVSKVLVDATSKVENDETQQVSSH